MHTYIRETTMKNNESEYQLEARFIKQLQDLNYEYIKINDMAELEVNLKVQLEKLNKVQLTDEEFRTIKLHLNKGSIFDKAVFLRQEYQLQRKEGLIHIKFFNSTDWCKNIFQVTNQITLPAKNNNNRFDVTILINGLPLVHVELKKSTINKTDAFYQIKRYKRDCMNGTLFDYVQIFVTSNGHTTKYIANNRDLEKKNEIKFVDFDNNPINNLSEFAFSFLEQCHIGKMIARYMILARDKSSEFLILMRPYQVNAVEAIMHKIDNKIDNGYIWHTTGSGKTLTSFKACELIAKREDVDKVFFIVDRKDLDEQTVQEYTKFKNPDDEDIKLFNNSYELIKHLKNPRAKVIVTTIHKLERTVLKEKVDKDLKCVLIFDECHRSQHGNRHKVIDEYFNYPQKFGFTGTPILAKNCIDEGKEYQTTEDVFGDALHKYLISDAIADKNVLGFEIDCKNILSLKDDIEDKLIKGINKSEPLKSAAYLAQIVKDIDNTYNRFTSDRYFNAMLACDGIQSAIKCYKLFKGEEVDGIKVELKHQYKIASVFSVTENQEVKAGNYITRDEVVTMMNDYNEMFKNDKNAAMYDYNMQSEYKQNVAKRFKDRELDLLIVSDMFLTGFDAKKLNTLYYDKEQKYHNLIQTLSRTNRTESEKKDYGKIICYRPIEKDIDEAIQLFSDGNAQTNVLKMGYDKQLEYMNKAIDRLLLIASRAEDVNEIKSEEKQKEFLEAMRDVLHNLNAIESYRDFSEDQLNTDLNNIYELSAKYKEIRDDVYHKNDKESILNDFDFEISLVKSFKVDYDYIKSLLAELDSTTKEEYDIKVEKLIKHFREKPELRSKIDLLEEFLLKYCNRDISIPDQFDKFIEFKNDLAIRNFAKENNLYEDKFIELYQNYVYDNELDSKHEEIESTMIEKLRMGARREKTKEIKEFLYDIKHNEIENIGGLDE